MILFRDKKLLSLKETGSHYRVSTATLANYIREGRLQAKEFGGQLYVEDRTAEIFFQPRWPLENPPPVAGSKSPTLRQQNGCKLIQFLF